MAIDSELLELLACPACKSGLILKSENCLHCPACRRRFPIRDDIPVLLLDEATLEEPPLPRASGA